MHQLWYNVLSEGYHAKWSSCQEQAAYNTLMMQWYDQRSDYHILDFFPFTASFIFGLNQKETIVHSMNGKQVDLKIFTTMT